MASKRNSLCIDEKVSLIRAIEKGEKKSDVAKRFGFSTSTVYTIWKNKEKILQAEMDGKFNKKLKGPKFVNLDRVMFSWYCVQRQNNMPITGPIIKAKAEKLAEQLNIAEFKASEGWLGKFKQRHRITYSKGVVIEHLEKDIRADEDLGKTASLTGEVIPDSVIRKEKESSDRDRINYNKRVVKKDLETDIEVDCLDKTVSLADEIILDTIRKEKDASDQDHIIYSKGLTNHLENHMQTDKALPIASLSKEIILDAVIKKEESSDEETIIQEDKADDLEPVPRIEEALRAAKLLDTFFFHKEDYPTISRHINEIQQNLQLKYWHSKKKVNGL